MTTTFNLTNDEIVTAALRKLAVLGDGQAASTGQLTTGTQALNVMLKAFESRGMPLWAITETDIPLTATRVYTVNPAPLKVIQALLVSGDSMIPLEQKSHYDYNLLGSPQATGTPTSFWYEVNGVLHVWPTPDANAITNKQVRLVGQRQFSDSITGTVLDLPQYWLEAVIYGLAYRLSPEYGMPLQDRQLLAAEAKTFLDEALSFGTEEGSLFLQPNREH